MTWGDKYDIVWKFKRKGGEYMNKPKTFIMPKEKKEVEVQKREFNFGKFFATLFLTFAVALILLLGFFYVRSIYQRVRANWNEIKFAYEKPEFVKTIREDYETKQNDLNKSFTTREKTPEQKLLDAVAEKVQEKPVKK